MNARTAEQTEDLTPTDANVEIPKIDTKAAFDLNAKEVSIFAATGHSEEQKMALASGHLTGMGGMLANADDYGDGKTPKEKEEAALKRILVQQQIDNLNDQIADLYSQRDDKIDLLERAQAQLSNLITQRDNVESRLADNLTQQQALRSRNAELDQADQDAASELAKLKKRQDDIAKKQEANQAELDKLDQEEEERNDEIAELEEDDAELQAKKESAAAQPEARFRETEKDLTQEQTELQAKINALRTETLNAEVTRKKLEDVTKKLEEESEKLQQAEDKITLEREAIAEERLENEEQLKQLEQERLTLNKELDTLNNDIAGKETEVANLNKEIAALNKEIAQLEAKRDKLENRDKINNEAETELAQNQEQHGIYQSMLGKVEDYFKKIDGKPIVVGDVLENAGFTEEQQPYALDHIDRIISQGIAEQKITTTENNPEIEKNLKYDANDYAFNNNAEYLKAAFGNASNPYHSEVAQTAENNPLVKAGVIPASEAAQQSYLFDGNTTHLFEANKADTFSNKSGAASSHSSAGIQPDAELTNTFDNARFGPVTAPNQEAANAPVYDENKRPLHEVPSAANNANTLGIT